MAEALEPKEQLVFWLNKVTVGAAQLPLDKIRSALYVVLSVWVINSLVGLIWSSVPMPKMQVLSIAGGPSGASSSSKNSTQSVDIKSMQSWHLFGNFDATEVVAEQKAPEPEFIANSEFENAAPTRLQLTLQGLVETENPELARAMISYQNKPDQYKIGDKLPGGSRVILVRVLSDRAILDNSGRIESLMLYDEKDIKNSSRIAVKERPKKSRNNLANNKVVDHRDNSALNELASEYKRQLLADPISLADVIRVSVAKDSDGNVIGYKVRPGKHRKQFKDFGFKSNDVVTSINGIELNNPTKALEVYRLLREASDATFNVLRGEEEMTVIVGLGEG